MNLSIVIPLWNEQPSLRELHRQLRAVSREQGYEMEIIFVDDGSQDGSWECIESLADEDSDVLGVCLRRNFGKATALAAGTSVARFDRVVTMDADLQDDPAEIPRLLAVMDQGYDLVSGWKRDRQDGWSRRLASRVFNWLVNSCTRVKLHDHNCGLKVGRREVFQEIELYGGLHRFIPVLAAARGFRVGETVVLHRPRKYGRSRYGAIRIVQGLLDLLTVCFLTGYRQRPQQLLGAVGLVSFLAGLSGLLFMGGYWVLRMNWYPEWTPLHQRPVVIYSVAALMLGAQLVTTGFLAELLVARDHERNRGFAVRDTVGLRLAASGNGRHFDVPSSSDSRPHDRLTRQTELPDQPGASP